MNDIYGALFISQLINQSPSFNDTSPLQPIQLAK